VILSLLGLIWAPFGLAVIAFLGVVGWKLFKRKG
jgi:hypothetical protein